MGTGGKGLKVVVVAQPDKESFAPARESMSSPGYSSFKGVSGVDRGETGKARVVKGGDVERSSSAGSILSASKVDVVNPCLSAPTTKMVVAGGRLEDNLGSVPELRHLCGEC